MGSSKPFKIENAATADAVRDALENAFATSPGLRVVVKSKRTGQVFNITGVRQGQVHGHEAVIIEY